MYYYHIKYSLKNNLELLVFTERPTILKITAMPCEHISIDLHENVEIWANFEETEELKVSWEKDGVPITLSSKV